MGSCWTLTFSLLLLIQLAPGTTGKEVLVLLDDFSLTATHSKFFAYLQEHNDLTFKHISDNDVTLQDWDEYLFDGLVIFGSDIEEFAGDLDVPAILDFIDSGHDMILATDSRIGEPLKEIATECGVDFDEANTFVLDHFAHPTPGNFEETLVVSPLSETASQALDLPQDEPVLFRGIGQAVGLDSELVVRFLDAPETAYSADPRGAVTTLPLILGKEIALVSGVQARNNARVAISGSIELFSNKFFAQRGASNEAFAAAVGSWAFHERGLLKVEHFGYRKLGEDGQSTSYRIGDHLEVFLKIFEWSEDRWIPFLRDDVQLEFAMLDPFVRKTLVHDGAGNFSTSFKLPDLHGVFKIKIEYDRPGLTRLSISEQVAVRPFYHDEYERFIPAAYPYYASCFTMMAGFFIFTFVFLHSK